MATDPTNDPFVQAEARARAAASAVSGRSTSSTKATPAPAGKQTTSTNTPARTGTAPTPSGKQTAQTGQAKAGATKPSTGQVVPGAGVAIDVTNVGTAPGSFAWTDYAIKYGQEYGVPPEFFLALIQAESGGNQYVVGDGGASVGLYQLHERGVGAGYTVEQRQDPELQFRLMAPRIAAAYNEGIALGYTGRNLAVYVGYQAEKPAAGNEANYAYAYDVVTSFATNGEAIVGGYPDIPMPSGGTPVAPWAGYSRGGSRGAAPITTGAEGSYTGQGVTEGLYYAGPNTYADSNPGYNSGSVTIGGIVGGVVSGVGAAVGSVLGSSLTQELADFFGGLNDARNSANQSVSDGTGSTIVNTPLGPIVAETSGLKDFLWNGGAIAIGAIAIIIGASGLIDWGKVTRVATDGVETAAKVAGAVV